VRAITPARGRLYIIYNTVMSEEKRYSHVDIILLLLREGKRSEQRQKWNKDNKFKLRVMRAQSVKKRKEEYRKQFLEGMNLLNEI
jgi:hypothetical protein